MRLFLITLAILAASGFATICGTLVAVIAGSSSCQASQTAFLAFIVFDLLVLLASLILFWRVSASGSVLARVILTIIIGVLQIFGLVFAAFTMMVALNC